MAFKLITKRDRRTRINIETNGKLTINCREIKGRLNRNHD